MYVSCTREGRIKRCLKLEEEKGKVSQSEEWVRSDRVTRTEAFDVQVELSDRKSRKALPRKKKVLHNYSKH